MPEKDTAFFAVRDFPEHTRRALKKFAAEYDVTMGQALEFLVETALADELFIRRLIDTMATYDKFDDIRRGHPRGEPFTNAGGFGRICDIIRLQEAQRAGEQLTEEQQMSLDAWKQANLSRIRFNPRYLDERLALERREQAAKRLEEEG